MGRRRHSDRGSISAFVIVTTMLLVACAGLVVDGGRIVGAKVSAADHAENAARAGAQEIVSLRTGAWGLDPARATGTANAYLASHGVSGTVTVVGNRITVTVHATVSTTLLALVGVSSKSVSATRSSDPVTQ
jgi:hypothetical protein